MMTRVLRIGVRICSLVMMLGMRLDVSGKNESGTYLES